MHLMNPKTNPLAGKIGRKLLLLEQQLQMSSWSFQGNPDVEQVIHRLSKSINIIKLKQGVLFSPPSKLSDEGHLSLSFLPRVFQLTCGWLGACGQAHPVHDDTHVIIMGDGEAMRAMQGQSQESSGLGPEFVSCVGGKPVWMGHDAHVGPYG